VLKFALSRRYGDIDPSLSGSEGECSSSMSGRISADFVNIAGYAALGAVSLRLARDPIATWTEAHGSGDCTT
jgi:hypothetical protein